jgi:hydroxymethylglutaryl-CoA lyase
MGVDTGVSLPALLDVVRTLPGLVARELSNPLVMAGPRLTAHAPPAWLADRFGAN